MRAASVSKQAMSYVLAEIFLISLLPFMPELESKEPSVVNVFYYIGDEHKEIDRCHVMVIFAKSLIQNFKKIFLINLSQFRQ